MKNKESEGVPENKGVGLDNTEDGELYKTIRSWRDNLYCGHYHNECMDLVNKIYSKFSLPAQAQVKWPQPAKEHNNHTYPDCDCKTCTWNACLEACQRAVKEAEGKQ